MEQNKTGKYLKYAIGEILLVVLGILIALSINNWNEERKSIEESKVLLAQVHKELAFNINRANLTINFYKRTDSLVYKVLNKLVTYDDYKNRQEFSWLLGEGHNVNLVVDAFKNLTDNQDYIVQEQGSIFLKLKKLYGPEKDGLDKMDAIVFENVFDWLEKLKTEKVWFYDYYFNNVITDEMVSFYLTDPFYLNEVTKYKMVNLGEHLGDTRRFRNYAMVVYDEISDYLNIKKDSSIIKDVNN